MASEAAIREIGQYAAEDRHPDQRRLLVSVLAVRLHASRPRAAKKGVELAGKMIEAARLLETDNLLVVPGSVYAPWIPDEPPVPHDVALAATAAVKSLLPQAEKHRVYLNMENIFANGFLHSPQEMNAFVDGFKSPWVKVHFDTGDIMQYHFPEHWIPNLGQRIQNIHLKEYSKKAHEFNLNAFRLLLDGTTDWPAVLAASTRPATAAT